MKNLANFLSLCCLVILFGYIIYNETGRSSIKGDRMSDQEVASPAYAIEDAAFPAVSFDVPQKISFAGEPVPLDLPDVKEGLDKELQMNIYLHSNTIFLIKRASRWFPQMEKILKAE